MTEADPNPFACGSTWLRADFHLHTKADKEFSYEGEENAFGTAYVNRLKAANIGLGVISNHNKFDADEFKALRRRAGKEGIGLLPSVELSVNDGANGVHTVIVFSEQWLEDGHDFINQFLNVAFTGRTPARYEHENARTNDDLLQTLKKLEGYNRDFFIIFAHVEAASGLWHELDGGRMQELADQPLIKKYCLGFQKVRTHDKADAKCRMKVKQWWQDRYPAEVEGSDPKSLDEIGRGRQCYLKIGDFSFDAVRYALTDFDFRVARALPKVVHLHANAIRFEGGLLNGTRVPFSPHLNCLIGIQGSGKSSVLECLRYTLNIPFGEKAQDRDYKDALAPYVLKSGGKVVVEATDRHGTRYEVRRILGHAPDVYVEGKLRPGISVRETIITKPMYFGQKDLSAAGKEFGRDLVEKLVGDSLKAVRQKIASARQELETAAENLISVQDEAQEKQTRDVELADIKYRLEQFDKHGVKTKLERQVEFSNDATFCDDVEAIVEEWENALTSAVEDAEENLKDVAVPESMANAAFFKKYALKIDALRKTVSDAKSILKSLNTIQSDLRTLHDELDTKREGLKEEFAKIERELGPVFS